MDARLLAATPLFAGLSKQEASTVASCLGARERSFAKGELVLRRGDVTTEIGVVLEGAVRIERSDFSGETAVLSRVSAGGVFAEAYACIPGEPLLVDVVATQDTVCAFLDVERLASPCARACASHRTAVANLLAIIARKNVGLSRRSFHVAPKTIRGKVLSFLTDEAARAGACEFDIPFNRQELADYLGVDRSALSAELGRMAKDGLIETRKSHFSLGRSGAKAKTGSEKI